MTNAKYELCPTVKECGTESSSLFILRHIHTKGDGPKQGYRG